MEKKPYWKGIRFEADLADCINCLRKKEGRTFSDMVRRLLRDHLKEQGLPKKHGGKKNGN